MVRDGEEAKVLLRSAWMGILAGTVDQHDARAVTRAVETLSTRPFTMQLAALARLLDEDLVPWETMRMHGPGTYGLEELIAVALVAVTAAREADDAALLSGLSHAAARAILVRYCMYEGRADLEWATVLCEESIMLTPVGHPDRSRRLGALANALFTRYIKTGKANDLRQAISRAEEALALAPAGHPDHASHRSVLTFALMARYGRRGQWSDLRRAVTLAEETLALTPVDDPDDHAALIGVTAALTMCYARDDAAFAPGNRLDRARHLAPVASALAIRYVRARNWDGARLASDMLTVGLALTPAKHPLRAVYLSAVLAVQGARPTYRDAETSRLALAEGLLARTPVDHPDHTRRRENVIALLRDRYARLGGVTDLRRAIELLEEGLALAPAGHADRVQRIDDLVTALNERSACVEDDAGPQRVAELLAERVVSPATGA